MKPECPCYVYLTIEDKSSSSLLVTFRENVRHDVTIPVSSKDVDGSPKDSMQDVLRDNWSTPPVEIFQKKIKNIPPDGYAAGNRSAAGTLKKAQHAKSSMQLQSSRLAELHQLLLSIDKEQKDEDNRNANNLGHYFRINSMFGYIQGLSIDNSLIHLVLFDDRMVRLFHVLARRDIIYLDATGNIVERIKPFKRIYYYALTVRHPFGLSPPLPVAEYITSSHTTDSLRHFLLTFREKENIVCQGNPSRPKLLVCDLSIPLYASALLEFNRETVSQYLRRTFHIVTGRANTDELNLMLVHICSAHSMNSAKRTLSKLYGNNKSKIHFGFRYFGRLISICNIEECKTFVKHGLLVMTSEFSTQTCEQSLTILQDSINTFLTKNDKEDERYKVIDEGSEADEGEAGDKDSDSTYQGSELEDISPASERNVWCEYWDDFLKNINQQISSTGELNKYYMPEFFHYLVKNILPVISMIGHMCLGDLRHLSENYEEILDIPEATGERNYLINNTTNATVEKFFAIQKANKAWIKIPLETFIRKHWHDLQGLQRYFWDGILKGISEKKVGSVGQKDIINTNLKRTFVEDMPEDMTDDDFILRNKYIPEERWGSTSDKKSVQRRTYLQPPKTPLNFFYVF